jgi:hypothetical protein
MRNMVLFWVLQALIDVFLVALAVSYLIQRRRLLQLEKQLEASLQRFSSGDLLQQQDPAINTPLGSATSTLSERQASPDDSDTTALTTSGRYALARKLLGEGRPLGEVSKRTGISETELVLLRKFTQSTQNYEAH